MNIFYRRIRLKGASVGIHHSRVGLHGSVVGFKALGEPPRLQVRTTLKH
jgi:hypothetical protein